MAILVNKNTRVSGRANSGSQSTFDATRKIDPTVQG